MDAILYHIHPFKKLLQWSFSQLITKSIHTLLSLLPFIDNPLLLHIKVLYFTFKALHSLFPTLMSSLTYYQTIKFCLHLYNWDWHLCQFVNFLYKAFANLEHYIMLHHEGLSLIQSQFMCFVVNETKTENLKLIKGTFYLVSGVAYGIHFHKQSLRARVYSKKDWTFFMDNENIHSSLRQAYF